MEILLATFTTLFSVVNPFGAMPVFLTLTEEDFRALDEVGQQEWQAQQAKKSKQD